MMDQWRWSRGQGLAEYALLFVLVVLIVLIVFLLLGPAIGNMFSNIVTNFPE